MEAHDYQFMKWIQDTTGYDRDTKKYGRILIPDRYQRSYSWEKPNWSNLLNDLNYLVEDEDQQHYLQSILVSSQKINLDHEKNYYIELADGQQRLITIMIMLKAAFDTWRIKGEQEDPDLVGIEKRKKWETYLYTQSSRDDGVNTDKWNWELPLLKVASSNEKDYAKVMNFDISQTGYELGKRTAPGLIREAYSFYREQFSKWSLIKLAGIPSTLPRFQLTEAEEQPRLLQTIFESANSKSVPLAVSELAKNYITMGLEPDDSQTIYEEFLQALDKRYNSVPKEKLILSDYYYHFLTSKIWPNADLSQRIGAPFKQDTNPFGKNTNEIYQALSTYLQVQHDKNDYSAKKESYRQFLKEFTSSIELLETLSELSESDIPVDQFKYFTKVKNSNILDANSLYWFIQLYNLLSKPPINRLNILFWLMNHATIFFDSRPPKKGGGYFVEAVFDIISSYLLRGQLLLSSGIAARDEGRTLVSLEKAYREVESQLGADGGMNSIAAKNFLSHLVSFLEERTQGFMNKTTNPELEEAINRMVNYSTATGKGCLKFFFVRIEDDALRNQKATGNSIYWSTKKDITLEHIYPQNPKDSKDTLYQQNWDGYSIKNESKSEQVRLTQSLGNLTLLTGKDNNEASNYSQLYKMKKIYEDSGVKILNESLFTLTKINSLSLPSTIDTSTKISGLDWDKTMIEQRGKELASLFMTLMLPLEDLKVKYNL